MRTLLAALLVGLVLAAPAAAGPGLLLGVSDDLLKWTKQPAALLRLDRDLGIRAIRITLQWQPGRSAVGRDESVALQRALQASFAGIRVVVAVYGPADQAPVDPASQEQYCSFVASIVRSYPTIGDVVVWNEPNAKQFWNPQSPQAYESLLARCWDAVHAVRADANVIAASAPRGTTGPARWYAAVGAAYRASGRVRPLFDSLGHNAYPDNDGEAPSKRHAHSATIAQGDYDRLMSTLGAAFGGTAQRRLVVWYMEDGFQTRTPLGAAYRGSERSQHTITPELQARRLTEAIELAYCQPAVGAFFNFQLFDERDLQGWQSGVLYADGTPKPAYAAFSEAAQRVRAGAISC